MDVHSYIDDERVTEPNRELTWKGSSKLAKMRAYLGLQDAAQKQREPSQEPGPWAGMVVHSVGGEPAYKLIKVGQNPMHRAGDSESVRTRSH